MAKKKDSQMYWILGILAIAIFLIGGNQGWFKSNLTINQPSTTTSPIQQQPQQTVFSSCSQVCTAQNFDTGYAGTSCQPGESLVTYGYTGQPALLTCCCYNEEEGVLPTGDCYDSDGGQDRLVPGYVEVDGDRIYDTCNDANTAVYEYYCDGTEAAGNIIMCLPGEMCIATRSGGYCGETSSGGWSEGDTVYREEGDSAITAGTTTIKYVDLSDYGFEPGGNCHLAVELHTYWDYNDPNICQGMTGQQGLKWLFYDSSRPNPRWTRTDYTPPSNLVESIYPVSWDGTNPWHLDVSTLYMIPGCNVIFHWDMEIYVAECD